MQTTFSIDLNTIQQDLETESTSFLTGMVERANKKIKDLTEMDNANRTYGVPYKERQEIINKIATAKELIDDYRAFMKKGVRPLNEWFDKGDMESLESNGYKWYIKTYFRRIF